MHNTSFLEALTIGVSEVVCCVGAGGKTSLLFQLAGEARARQLKVLVTTTTKMFVPAAVQYDALDLSGALLFPAGVAAPGIYVGGLAETGTGKMRGVGRELLAVRRKLFDLVLIEADGAAGKPLKGWKDTEPVIPEYTTMTLGVIDIETIGRPVEAALIHRLELFCRLTGARIGETVSVGHLAAVIVHEKGLFKEARGRRMLYINKVESTRDRCNVELLRVRLAELVELHSVAGSLHRGTFYG